MFSKLLELNDEAREILKGYPALVELDREEYYVFSDIHGFLEAAKKVRELVEQGNRVIMLGDYSGRTVGCFSPKTFESLYVLYETLVEYPDRLMLLRGNHEDQAVHFLPVSSFLKELKEFVPDEELLEYEELFLETFREMPITAIARGILMHGGPPIEVETLKRLYKPKDACKELYEIFRNVPSSSGKTIIGGGIHFNCLGERKVSNAFGNDVVEKLKEMFGIEFVLVGHIHPSSGFRKFRKLHDVYAVVSSRATCSVSRPKYVYVSEGLEGMPL